MDFEDLEKLIKGRRSIRRWKKNEVSDDLLRKAVELGTWAPNGGNYQGWHFAVIKNRSVIDRIADAVQRINDKVVSWPESTAVNRDQMERYRANASQWRNAPVLVGAFSRHYESVMDKVLASREHFDNEAREVLLFRKSAPTCVQNVAAAIATMLLVFHQMGLGAVWLGGALMAKREIEEILKVSDELNLVCLVAVGYPDEAPRKDRIPIEKVLEFIR